MTSTIRKRRHDARKKAGLVRVEFWVPADKEQAVRDAYEAICKTPNAATEEALADVKAGRVKAFDSLEALMKDLNGTP